MLSCTFRPPLARPAPAATLARCATRLICVGATAKDAPMIDDRVAQLAAALGTDVLYAQMLVEKAPRLKDKSPKALRSKFEYVAEATSVPLETVIKLISAEPSVLLKSPASLVGRLEVVAGLLGVSLQEAAKAVEERPELLGMNYDTMRGARAKLMKELRNISSEQL